MDPVQLQLEIWGNILTTISTIILVSVAIGGVLKYFQEKRKDRELRQEELAWRKTQVVFQLADEINKDERFQTAYRLIEFGIGLPPGCSLAKLLGTDKEILSKQEIELRYIIDRYLDFFDKLYHFTFVTHSLEVRDIEYFGWQIARIGETPEIRDFAMREGFDSILRLYDELYKVIEEAPWFEAFHQSQPLHRLIPSDDSSPLTEPILTEN
jgi:hypothetical protein